MMLAAMDAAAIEPGGASLGASAGAGSIPQLWATEPSGAYAAWKAHAVGRGATAMSALLERDFLEGMSEEQAVFLALRALLQVLDPALASAAAIEVAVIRQAAGAELLDITDVDHYIAQLREEIYAERGAAALKRGSSERPRGGAHDGGFRRRQH